MPNNTTCILTVKADKKELSKIKKFVKSKESLFDCNNIIPMPKELNEFSAPTRIVSEEEYKEARKAKKDKMFCGFPMTKEIQQELLKKYGSDNWYNWAVENWGTKWGAYDITDWDDNTISFYTAWSPPMPVIIELSKRFPKVEFVMKYADEGAGFVGIISFINGEENIIAHPKSDSKEFNELYLEITGINLDEEND
jgi:hypothetical protein